MRDRPTPAEIDQYREGGFVVIDELLDEGELDAWRAAVDQAVADRGDSLLPDRREISKPAPVSDDERKRRASYYAGVFKQRVNLWKSDERMRALMLDSRLGRMAAELAGVDGIRVWHDQALIKLPYANPTAFHLDVPYWSFTSPHAISMWLALDDATLENGCMCYVAGSHKAEKYDNVSIGPELGAIFDVYPEWKSLPIVHCPIPAGSAVYHNGLVCHGAGANLTHGLRRAMTCGYMPDGSRFNGTKNILSDEQVAKLAIGDTLDDEAQNPLLYSSALPAGSRP